MIFAASPLANGNNDEFAQALVDDQGRRLLSPEYNGRKMAKAAAACKDVMELGVYELYHAHSQVLIMDLKIVRLLFHLLITTFLLKSGQMVGKILTLSNLIVTYLVVMCLLWIILS